MEITTIYIYTVRMNDRLFYLNRETNYSPLFNDVDISQPYYSVLEQSAKRTSGELSRRLNKQVNYVPASITTDGCIKIKKS